ncbi:hypothetical protein NIES208_03140 [[Limnothrix rosea] IAM M-220]|nr:hypothetical protein NIES208_03140 [[Limnothrix rosea] IAM M-220]
MKNANELGTMPEYFNELLQQIYSTHYISPHQAQELRQIFLDTSLGDDVHISRLRLENDIARGLITKLDPSSLI